MTHPDSAGRNIRLEIRFPDRGGEPFRFQLFDSNGHLRDQGDVLPPSRGGVLTFLIPEGEGPLDPFVDPFAPAQPANPTP